MNRRDIAAFDSAWNQMLRKHGLTSGLHMKELGPGGRYPHLVGEACAAMLADAVGIINEFRIFTFAATWDNRKHEVFFSGEMRKKFLSVYGLTFMMAIEINRASAAHQHYQGEIDYVLDDGNSFKWHLPQMHDSISKIPELAAHKVGALTFSTDSATPALQAADVLAWATRRHISGMGFKGFHQPLGRLFDEFYVHSPAPDDVVRRMSRRFGVAELGIDPDSGTGRILLQLGPILWGCAGFGLLLGIAGYWLGPSWAAFGVGFGGLVTAVQFALKKRFIWLQ